MALLVIIIIVLVLIVISAIVGTIALITLTNPSSNSNNSPPTPPLPQCTDLDPQNFPDISTLPCCDFTARKYVNNLNGVDYDLVTGPSQIDWFTVCREFCIQGWDFQQQQCINLSGQSNYERCQNQLEPSTCRGIAAPLFRNGNKLYFGQSATSALCPNQRDCSNLG